MSSDQIPLRAVQSGLIDRFGQIDPTDGGKTHRYVLSADYANNRGESSTNVNAYVINYSLRLFSDFTYFLSDPLNMDQFVQTEDWFVTGVNADHSWGAGTSTYTVGYQFRNDNIAPLGLYATKAQQVIGTTRIDHVVEVSNAFYAQTERHITQKLRLTLGLRGDAYNFKVNDLRPENSGNRSASIVSPKVALSFQASSSAEYYADFGEGFHSNDAGNHRTGRSRNRTCNRSRTGQIIQGATPLVRAVGEEFGARFAFAQRLRTTVSLWKLNLASELIFQGDAGTTSPGRPSDRYGIEIANFWQPRPGTTVDFDLLPLQCGLYKL